MIGCAYPNAAKSIAPLAGYSLNLLLYNILFLFDAAESTHQIGARRRTTRARIGRHHG
jgi:hypothetical protein